MHKRYTWPLLRKQEAHPVGGNAGRPWRRALNRAYAEDAARKKRHAGETRTAIVATITGHLPKATKLDKGSLAKIMHTGPQRLGFVRRHGFVLIPHRHASAT